MNANRVNIPGAVADNGGAVVEQVVEEQVQPVAAVEVAAVGSSVFANKALPASDSDVEEILGSADKRSSA
ncbi:unnamed protein product [Amoebophrya sp. A25]|nr:unnamed protein product [Amoebophrya sp. A25]|eukprot:GSA25T00024989001.1